MLVILIVSLIAHLATGKVEVSQLNGNQLKSLIYQVELIPLIQILLTLC